MTTTSPHKTSRRNAWIAAAAAGVLATAGIASLANASAAGGTDTCGPATMRAAWGQHVWLDAAPGLRDPQRLADALKLTPAQKPAWDAYVATLQRPAAANAPAGTAAPGAPGAATTAPQRLENAITAAQARQQAASERLAAMKTLYAQLTPEQRHAFDAVRGFGGHGAHAPHGPGARDAH